MPLKQTLIAWQFTTTVRIYIMIYAPLQWELCRAVHSVYCAAELWTENQQTCGSGAKWHLILGGYLISGWEDTSRDFRLIMWKPALNDGFFSSFRLSTMYYLIFCVFMKKYCYQVLHDYWRISHDKHCSSWMIDNLHTQLWWSVPIAVSHF